MVTADEVTLEVSQTIENIDTLFQMQYLPDWERDVRVSAAIANMNRRLDRWLDELKLVSSQGEKP